MHHQTRTTDRFVSDKLRLTIVSGAKKGEHSSLYLMYSWGVVPNFEVLELQENVLAIGLALLNLLLCSFLGKFCHLMYVNHIIS